MKLPQSLEKEIKKRATEFASFEDGLNTEVDASDEIAYETGANFGALAVLEKAEKLAEAVKAKNELLVCYRIGKSPSSALFKRLEKADKALAEWKAWRGLNGR